MSKQQGYVMAHFRKVIITARILALLALPAATPAAAATFDGTWNVQIASSNSACNAGTSVSIGINNGQVASNSSMVAASGCTESTCVRSLSGGVSASGARP